MFRNKTKCREAAKRLAEEAERMNTHRAWLKQFGLSDAEIQRVLDPVESFHLQRNEEIEAYERNEHD